MIATVKTIETVAMKPTTVRVPILEFERPLIGFIHQARFVDSHEYAIRQNRVRSTIRAYKILFRVGGVKEGAGLKISVFDYTPLNAIADTIENVPLRSRSVRATAP